MTYYWLLAPLSTKSWSYPSNLPSHSCQSKLLEYKQWPYNFFHQKKVSIILCYGIKSNFLRLELEYLCDMCQFILPMFSHPLVHTDTLDASHKGHSRLVEHTHSFRHSFQIFTLCLGTGEVTMNRNWFFVPQVWYSNYLNLEWMSNK